MKARTKQFGTLCRVTVRVFAGITLALHLGCGTPMPGKLTRLSGNYPPKPKEFKVEVFEGSPPSRPFEEIARLDVHIEQTFFASPNLKDALPELLKQARLAGADAIINITERKNSLNETRVLHATATGIRFKDSP